MTVATQESPPAPISFRYLRAGPGSASLRKHSFLLALRRWGRSARNIPGGEERGETDVFARYGSAKDG